MQHVQSSIIFRMFIDEILVHALMVFNHSTRIHPGMASFRASLESVPLYLSIDTDIHKFELTCCHSIKQL